MTLGSFNQRAGAGAPGGQRQRALSDPSNSVAGKIDEILDAVIAAAPECLQQRVILQAIDWSMVAPNRIELLLAGLVEARLPLPRWLMKALLLAGHTLNGSAAAKLPVGLALLNRLNDAHGELSERGPIASALTTLSHDADLEADVTAAIVNRLVALSWDDDALQLALAQYERAPQVLDGLGSLDAHIARLPVVRLRVSGSSTTWTLIEGMRPAFAVEGLRAEITESPFGAVLADLMSPPEDVDALVVLIDHEGLLPRDWRLGSADLASRISEQADAFGDALDALADRARVPLLINTLPVPPAPTVGLLDRRHSAGLRRAVDRINARILDAAERSGSIVAVDADEALAPLAVREQSDPRLWFYGRIAYSAEAMRLLSRAYARAWKLYRRGPAKVLAVDFDNTLWGGVYGDDGVDQLLCSHDAPGNAFLAMQQECLRLKGQGMLLVALSKNNPDALTAFTRHPGMALKPDHFAAVAVNWRPKAENIRELAAELNLGLDSFVFIDDSPHEREAMRQLCPEVLVPELPRDPAERPLWLRRLTTTWPVRLTAEDEARAGMYAAERKARDARAGAVSLEAHLAGLEQRLILSFVSAKTLGRAAQMHQRTNQFNLTTERLTEADIAEIAADESGGMAVIGRVADKFGDHGLVIASTVMIADGEAVIRTLLMSCRVIGREVERAFLGEVICELKRRGISRVRGTYIPTAKNAMVRDFYSSCGFDQIGGAEGTMEWRFAVEEREPPSSSHVTVTWEN